MYTVQLPAFLKTFVAHLRSHQTLPNTISQRRNICQWYYNLVEEIFVQQISSHSAESVRETWASTICTIARSLEYHWHKMNQSIRLWMVAHIFLPINLTEKENIYLIWFENCLISVTFLSSISSFSSVILLVFLANLLIFCWSSKVTLTSSAAYTKTKELLKYIACE